MAERTKASRGPASVQLVLITLNGFKQNIWSEDLVDSSLSAEKIFGSSR